MSLYFYKSNLHKIYLILEVLIIIFHFVEYLILYKNQNYCDKSKLIIQPINLKLRLRFSEYKFQVL